MKKDGFTLIELLAVIVVLALLGVVAGVTISRSINNSENKAQDLQAKTIKEAAVTWANANVYSLPEEGDSITITLNTLITEGYIEENAEGTLENLSTNELYSRSKTYIVITNDSGNFTYDFIPSMTSDVTSEPTNSNPTITLKGSNTVTVAQGSNYTDAGATAKKYDGTDLTSEIVLSSTISTANPGTYKVIYVVTDPDNNLTNSIERTVIVK